MLKKNDIWRKNDCAIDEKCSSDTGQTKANKQLSSDFRTTFKRLSDSPKETMATDSIPIMTQEIITEFVVQIDTEKEYDLKELKQILGDIYKAKTAKPKKAPKKAKVSDENENSDASDNEKGKTARAAKADKPDKPKRAPSAYNNYVKQRVISLKTDQPATLAQELLKIAAGEWKLLDKREQEKYKTVV